MAISEITFQVAIHDAGDHAITQAEKQHLSILGECEHD